MKLVTIRLLKKSFSLGKIVIPAKAGIQPFDKLRVTVMVSLSNHGFPIKTSGMTNKDFCKKII